MTLTRIGAVAAALVIASCTRAASDHALDIAGPVSTLQVGDASNASPFVAALGDRVVVVWVATVDSQSSVYAAVSRDDGRTFGAPVRVNDVPGDVRTGGDQGPRVAGAADDMAVIWASKLGGTSRIRMVRSADGGATFSPATTISGDGLTGARGWASITRGRDGVFHAAWLDGRDAAGGMDGMSMAHGDGHAMRQDLYQATWRSGGATTETRIATGVCFCCKTAVTVAPDGTTYVAWRHVYPTDLRDMAVASSVDDGRTFSAPVRVSEDHWQIAGCPEDGPAIAADNRNVLHIVWATVDPQAGKKDVFYSTSSDRGRTFARRTPLGVDAAHAQLTSLGEGVAAVWDEASSDGRQIKLAVLGSPAGLGTGAAAGSWPSWTLGGGQPGTRPAIAVTSGAIVVGWTTQSGDRTEIRVQRIAR